MSEEVIAEVFSMLARIERKLDAGTVREAYSVEQAAARLNLSEWTVRQACNRGRVRAEKAANGRNWRIPHDELVRVEAEGLSPPPNRA